MTATPKVENFCIGKRTKVLYVDEDVRACINCIWYEPHYRENRGNIRAFCQLTTGTCLKQDRQRGALRQPCKDYETKNSRPC